MVSVLGKPLIEWQLASLSRAGISDIGLVRGYRGELFEYDITYFENTRWDATNMVMSLYEARKWLRQDDCLICYSDIIYSEDAVRKLISLDQELGITYDPSWQGYWEERFENPLDDAETFQISQDGYLTEIGNRARSVNEIKGQYMGMLKFRPSGWKRVESLLEEMSGRDRDKLDMTSLLQKLIQSGEKIYTAPISDLWCEVDSATDLKVCEKRLAPLQNKTSKSSKPQTGRGEWRIRLYQGLSLFTLGLAAMASNIFGKRKDDKIRVVQFSHMYGGNIKAFSEFVERMDGSIETRFMPTDPAIYRRLKNKKIPLLNRLSLKDMIWAIDADIYMTNIQTRRFLTFVKRFRPNAKFIQTLHSINYIKIPDLYFNALKKFDSVFVSSEWSRENYFGKLGVPMKNIRTTGFISSDTLLNPGKDRNTLFKEFELDPDKPVVVFAPTIAEAVELDSVIPFGMTEHEFLQKINDWSEQHSVQFVFRSHPRDHIQVDASKKYPHIVFRPGGKYPSAQLQLMIADVLITDWSGIGLYFLAFDRPLIYIHTNLPGGEGTSWLSHEDRPGYIVEEMEGFLKALQESILHPERYLEKFSKAREATRNKAFGNTLDGHCAERYHHEILKLLNK